MRIRTNLFDDMLRMHEGIFGDMLYPQGKMLSHAGTSMLPYRRVLSDVNENENEFIAKIELPGVEKEDIKINAKDDKVEVSVENKEEIEKEGKDNYCCKKSYAGFSRSFGLPEGTDIEKIEASYKNGVLSLKIPKKELPPTKTRLIEVN